MNKRFKLRAAGVAALIAASTGSAMAALSTEVTTAIADMKADGILIAGAFLVACIAMAAVKVLRRGSGG